MTVTPVRLDLMQVGMNVYAADRYKRLDAEALFDRAVKRNVKWVGGTEAGQQEDKDLYRQIADQRGYRLTFHRGNDSWIAVQKSFILGGFDTYYEKVVDASDGVGPHGDRGVFSVEFDTDGFGHVTVIVMHLLTKGKPSAKDPERRVNVPWNERLLRAAGEHARLRGDGGDLVFYQGDQNIVDRTGDTFMGEPLTSTWDELKKWENTGHGNIDVIASYDPDTRVAAAYVRSLNDREFPLHTDHFLVESGFDVLPLVGSEPRRHACPECGKVHKILTA